MTGSRPVGRRRGTRWYRRARHLVCYWHNGQSVLHNYRTGTRVPAHETLFRLLDGMGDWISAGTLAATSQLDAHAVTDALGWLRDRSLIDEVAGRPPGEPPSDAWTIWGTPAAFFHFGTRDVAFQADPVDEIHALDVGAVAEPGHAASPRRRHARPDMPARDFTDVLLDRRTWRRFGRRPASADALMHVLALTFGVQRRLDLGHSVVALRTSPSAGARQPLDAYVLVRNVTGIRPGLYHYQPVARSLDRLESPGDARAAIRRYLPGQTWYAGASCLILMTAVLSRTASKYDSPHAYRTVLLEAGHFCQTFCLTATALGLAPFCTAALADSAIERDLGVDPSNEPVVYAAGFGTRPPTDRAGRTPRGERVPREVPVDAASRPASRTRPS